MPGPKFTIVTASYNSIRTIRETIESVIAQDFKDWEHWVIDGGSKDATIDLVKEYPHIKWISERDGGLYEAMNKGIARASGDILLMLNSDDCLTPGALRMVAEGFDAHPNWDAAFGDIIYVDSEGKEIYRREEAGYDYDVLRLSGICYIIHQTLYVKKALHDRIGIYRHKDFVNCADYEFILRMGKNGATVGHIPDYLIRYRIHDFGLTADDRARRNIARESGIILKEYGQPEGWPGKALRVINRGKRQLQKLAVRGKLDLVPGNVRLKKYIKAKNSVSSNALERMEAQK
ncbi:MAG TPA: glycosyltransferase family 2 protein [Verrucomicrobiae bacterium]|nr:glycosyltransferase family 2 protein [Verrucomicrobiae bacterium]